MIITLTGTISHKTKDYALIEVQGVGYQVFMNAPSLSALRVGSKARLWTHEYLREDSRELYGFLMQNEHALFDRLLAVSGVGPKTALALLSLGSVAEIERMIENGDIDWLCRVPGVGKKTAQKIVLELKGKLVGETTDAASEDVMNALVSLGYSREQARDAISMVASKEETVEGRLRAALRELGR